MTLPHRWEYQPNMYLYECVPIPLGGVEDGRRCKGCGVTFTDQAMHEMLEGNSISLGLNVLMDMYLLRKEGKL